MRGSSRSLPKYQLAFVQPNTSNTPARGTAANIDSKPSEFWTAFLLCLFLGFLGAHRFYAKKFKSGAIQLVTLGFCGLWSLVDAVTILLSKFKNSAGVLYKNPNPKVSWGIFAAVCILGIISGGSETKTGDSAGGSSGRNQNSASEIDPSPVGVWIEGDTSSVYNRLTVRSSGSYAFETVDFTGDVKGGHSGTWELRGTTVHYIYDGGEITGYRSRSGLSYGATTFRRQ